MNSEPGQIVAISALPGNPTRVPALPWAQRVTPAHTAMTSPRFFGALDVGFSFG